MRRDGAEEIHDGGRDASDDEERDSGLWAELREAAFALPSTETPLAFWGRAAFWLFMAYYGWYYVSLSVSRSQTKVSFVDYIIGMADLVFHEAGHIILIPLGSFMSTLGGSLFQVLIPAICLFAFLKQRNGFAAAAMLWWAGQNLIDVAPYIGDASAQRLILLGGVTGREVPGYHDWNNLLTRLDMLAFDQALAGTSHTLGVMAIGLALLWSGYLVVMQYRQRSSLSASPA